MVQQVQRATPAVLQPQQITIINKTESGISRGIANAMGPVTMQTGGLGFLAGSITGLGWTLATDNPAWMVAGPIIGTVMGAGTAALATKGFQVAADVTVNATVFAVKLPFRAVYAVGSLGAQGVSSVYNLIMNNSEIKSDDSDQLLANQSHIA